MLHAHTTIWKERGMLTTRNSPIKHKDVILAHLDGVQLPTQVAIVGAIRGMYLLWARETAKFIKLQKRQFNWTSYGPSDWSPWTL